MVERLGLGEPAQGPAAFREVVDCRSHVGVIPAQGGFQNVQRATLDRLGIGVPSLVFVECPQVTERPAQIGLMRRWSLLEDGQGAQELVLCFLVFGLGAAGKAQAVEHHGHTRVIRAEVTLANRYGLSIGEFGGLVVGLPVLLFSRVEQRFGSPSIPARRHVHEQYENQGTCERQSRQLHHRRQSDR